ncbi:MAG TPA: T6SS immunity protein Tdi1 domain-containing protein [Haliangium sp.]|nr:T6SS immunity protein Tdi1 domain-containing protein [Haliangium sp.]
MPFKTFHDRHGPGEKYRDLDEEATQRLAARLPAEVLELLRTDGLCSYGGQLFFTVDDKDFEAARLAWLPGFPQVAVFARNAFGDLFLWDGNTIQVLMPHIGRVGPAAYNITRFFDETLTSPSFIKDNLLRSEVAKAAEHAGRLEWDEMYGYEPTLALGGSGRVDTIRRFKVNEHQVLLSQLQPLRPLI